MKRHNGQVDRNWSRQRLNNGATQPMPSTNRKSAAHSYNRMIRTLDFLLSPLHSMMINPLRPSKREKQRLPEVPGKKKKKNPFFFVCLQGIGSDGLGLSRDRRQGYGRQQTIDVTILILFHFLFVE